MPLIVAHNSCGMKDFYATAGQQMLMMPACDRIIFKSRAIALLIQSEYRNSIVPLMLVMLASQPKFKESLAAIADDQRFQCTVKFMLMTPRCKVPARCRRRAVQLMVAPSKLWQLRFPKKSLAAEGRC